MNKYLVSKQKSGKLALMIFSLEAIQLSKELNWEVMGHLLASSETEAWININQFSPNLGL